MASQPKPNPDRLFDRTFRPGHPFKPRLSRTRRWGMAVLFLFLASVIAAYWYLTDTRRVREMAESYLENLIGGHVEVGGANLSIFEGLRLEGVKVYVDADGGADGAKDDALLFSAQSFLVKYNPQTMLSGRLEATQIVAIDPHVRLTENLDTGRWNYQRLHREPAPTSAPTTGPSAPRVLPEILLRNAQVHYSEIRRGNYISLGSMAIEGQLTPADDAAGRYLFDLQSRGASERMGPVISGSLDLASGAVDAQLRNFEFGRDVRSVLPAQVRHWWEQHELAGRVDIPLMQYKPARNGRPAVFKVETDLNGVTLAVQPQEWMSRDENRRRRELGLAVDLMGRVGFGPTGVHQQLASLANPSSIRLEKVSGRFTFTEDGVEISDLSGRVETNGFKIAGHIDGYSLDSPAELTVTSLDSEHIFIPAAPRFVSSMPRQVREIYDRLRPQGTCDIVMHLKRAEPGSRPEVSGEVSIVDGQFVFDRFAYPMRNATGTITFGRDTQSGMDYLQISELKGYGVERGPNANSSIVVNGWIAPLGPTAGFNIRVHGEQISSEPALRNAFPLPVQETLKIFGATDLATRGASPLDAEFPKFFGSFTCEVIRPVGHRTPWTINTDIKIERASGALKAFSYPLDDVSVELKIRKNHVEIINAVMTKGDATLRVDGRVDFGNDKPLEPNLRIEAKNVPIDKDLLMALSPQRREWLERAGVGGLLDLSGRVFRKVTETAAAADAKPVDATPVAPAVASSAGPAPAPKFDLDFDFELALRDGTVWPTDGTFAVSGLAGNLRLTPDRLSFTNLSAKRGDGEINARGALSWANDQPRLTLSANARDLELDPALYRLLPAKAQRSWDEVQPRGTVDADLSFSGDVGRRRTPTTLPADAGAVATDSPAPVPPVDVSVVASAAPPTSAPAAPSLELTIRPRKLSVALKALPYRLDDLTGTVSILSERVLLKDLTARHGAATISLGGTGSLGPDPVWDLTLSGTDVAVDDDLRTALPPALTSVIDSLKLNGKANFAFSKLSYRPDKSDAATAGVQPVASLADVAPTPTAPPAPQTQPAAGKGPDLDFAVAFSTAGASLNVGVPLENVAGSGTLAGTVRKGKLHEMTGSIDADSMTFASRPIRGFHTDLLKPAGQDGMQLNKMRAALADGDMAGQVNLLYPENGPSRYGINLVLHNADVAQLTPDPEAHVNGRLTASLALEGSWDDPASRRGRGDARVEGKEMYKIPLVLGLLQITNLSLPISSPFTAGVAQYSVDGRKVAFEQIELRASNMTMQGTGSMDFDSKRVRMTFTTDNPNWPKLPIVTDLFRGARQELFQIHVRGTIEEPKVSASAMNTFQTTVDEVFRGDGR